MPKCRGDWYCPEQIVQAMQGKEYEVWQELEGIGGPEVSVVLPRLQSNPRPVRGMACYQVTCPKHGKKIVGKR